MAYRVDPKMSQTNIGFAAEEISELPIYSDELLVCTQEEENSKGAVDNTTDAFFNLAAIDQTESPFSSNPVSEPDLSTHGISQEDVERYSEAGQFYLDSLDADDPNYAVEAFQNLLSSVVMLSGIDRDAELVKEATAKLGSIRAEHDQAVEDWHGDRKATSLMVAKASPGFFDAAPEVPAPAKIGELKLKVAKAEDELAKAKLKREESATLFEALVKDVVASSARDVAPEDVAMAPFAMSLMAKTMVSVGEIERAQDYYNAASLSADTKAQATWYRLEALHLDAMKGGAAAADAIPKIKLIREGFAHLSWEAEVYEAGGAAAEGSIGELDKISVPKNPGLPGDIQALDAFSWKVHYEVLHASLAEPGAKSASVERRLGEIEDLEEERRQTLASRKDKANNFEANFHISNMQLVASSWTGKGGTIERSLRSDGAEKAASLHDELKKDLADAKELGNRLADGEGGGWFKESVASLDWQVLVDGYFSRDLPLDAIKSAAENVVPGNPGSKSVSAQLSALSSVAKNGGFENRLFNEDGSLNKDVDVSDLEAGKLAGTRAKSAYWSSPDTLREMGLPFLAASGCYGLTLLTSWTGPGAFLAAGTCAFAAVVGNQQYNTRVLGAEPARQASMTGLSRIDEDEAGKFKTAWMQNAALNTLFSASFSNVGVSAGRLLVGGGSFAVRGAGNMLSSSIASAKAAKSFSSFLWNSTKAVGNVMKQGGGGIWKKMTLGDKIHAVASLGWPADYYFINADGDVVWGDRKTDHWIGYAGKTAFWGGLAYRGFSLTWRKNSLMDASKGMAEAKNLLGFGDKVASHPLRGWISRAGFDLTMSDYYLFNEREFEDEKGDTVTDPYSFQFVDFGKKHTSFIDNKDFDRQFKVDTWFGYGGTVMAGADWAVTEFRSFPLYINSASRVNLAKGRVIVGSALTGWDLADNRTLDTWWKGGVGGALLMNEVGAAVLQIDAWGSMVGLVFRAGTEWIMQWQQDVPISAPDAKRLMWASAESAFMRFPAKAFMMGHHYMKTFPLGARMLSLHKGALASKYTLIKGAANMIRPVQGLGGKPVIDDWYPTVAKRGRHSMIDPTTGEKVVVNVLKQKNRVFRRLINDPEPTRIEINGKLHELTSNFKDSAVKNLLKSNGYFIKNGNLWKQEVWFKGEVRIGGKKMTAKRFESLAKHEIEKNVKLLDKQGVVYVKFSDMAKPKAEGGHGFSADKVAQIKKEMAAAGAYNKGVEGALMKRWYMDPDKPTILSSHGHYNGVKESNCVYKIGTMRIEGKKISGDPAYDLWFKLDRELRPISEVSVGGTTLNVFRGPLSKPRMKWTKFDLLGIAYQGGLMAFTSDFMNENVFGKVMDGDPKYQQKQRFFNYAVSEGLTHPIVQWPLGYDTALAQLVGRTIGIGVNMLGNKIFPTYLNTWPGLPMYQRALDDNPGGTMSGKPMEPLVTWSNTMSSWQVMPFGTWWGVSHDTVNMFEDRAINTFRLAEQCQSDLAKDKKLAEAMSNTYNKHSSCAGVSSDKDFESSKALEEDLARNVRAAMGKSPSCKALPDKTVTNLRKFSVEDWLKESDRSKMLEKRVKKLASNFEGWIEREKKTRLSVMERRALVLMAAHIKNTLAKVRKESPDMLPLYEAWEKLEETYSDVLFSKIPGLAGDDDWADYIRDVNRGRAKACDFHYYLHLEGSK